MSTRLPRPADCNTCAEPIRFVRMPTGKHMPVNPRPADDGSIAAQLVGGRLHGHVITPDNPARPSERLRFRPHYVTCQDKPKRPKVEKPAVEPDTALW